MSRLAGHELLSEGAAFRWVRTAISRPQRVSSNGVGGRGFAICSCGERSPVLESGGARKRWHREHKDEMRAKP